MANFARIINSIAVDVSIDPALQFHPELVADFVEVPDNVKPGWRLIEDVWTAPELSPVPTQEHPKVSPVEFKLLFSSAERIAIKAARASDAVLDDFFRIVDDPRLTTVDLGLQSTQNGLAYLVELGLITGTRRDEILQGVIQ